MEVADLINNMVSTVPTNGSSTSGTQKNRKENTAVSRMSI